MSELNLTRLLKAADSSVKHLRHLRRATYPNLF
jgi:hypothetical protein